MRFDARVSVVLASALFCLSALADAQPARREVAPPPVTRVPATFFDLLREEDRDVARRFYTKHIDVKGMPVVASAAVDNAALQRTASVGGTRLYPGIVEAREFRSGMMERGVVQGGASGGSA